MIGFVKSSTIIAIVLLSATFAYAGDLKAVHEGGNNMHPVPQHGKVNALDHVTNDTARAAINEAISREEADKLRKLRPVR